MTGDESKTKRSAKKEGDISKGRLLYEYGSFLIEEIEEMSQKGNVDSEQINKAITNLSQSL